MKRRVAFELPDHQLIQNYLLGDAKSIGTLYERYFQKVHYKCYTFTKNSDEAYDLTQEILLKAFDKISTFRFSSSFSTWLYRIAQNHCIEYLRKKKVMMYDEFSDFETGFQDEEVREDAELQNLREAQLVLAMQKLSEGERAMLTMKYLEGNSILDLQNYFQLSANAVKMRLQRAKQKIGKHLQITPVIM